MHRQVSFHGRHQAFSFQRSVFSKGGERRSAQEVGICQKYFCSLNQAGSSPHTKWMKFSADYFSWRDSFCLCPKTRNPHWLWLAERSSLRIFGDRQAFRLDLIFQKQQNQSKDNHW